MKQARVVWGRLAGAHDRKWDRLHMASGLLYVRLIVCVFGIERGGEGGGRVLLSLCLGRVAIDLH